MFGLLKDMLTVKSGAVDGVITTVSLGSAAVISLTDWIEDPRQVILFGCLSLGLGTVAYLRFRKQQESK